MSKCLLHVVALRNHLKKSEKLTDVKRMKIKKMIGCILEGIDKQLRIDPLAVVRERKIKHGYYKFSDFADSNFSGLFRFRSPDDLRRLLEGFGIPQKLIVHTYKTTGEEILTQN